MDPTENSSRLDTSKHPLASGRIEVGRYDDQSPTDLSRAGNAIRVVSELREPTSESNGGELSADQGLLEKPLAPVRPPKLQTSEAAHESLSMDDKQLQVARAEGIAYHITVSD